MAAGGEEVAGGAEQPIKPYWHLHIRDGRNRGWILSPGYLFLSSHLHSLQEKAQKIPAPFQAGKKNYPKGLQNILRLLHTVTMWKPHIPCLSLSLSSIYFYAADTKVFALLFTPWPWTDPRWLVGLETIATTVCYAYSNEIYKQLTAIQSFCPEYTPTRCPSWYFTPKRARIYWNANSNYLEKPQPGTKEYLSICALSKSMFWNLNPKVMVWDLKWSGDFGK